MGAEIKVKCIYYDYTYFGNKKVYQCLFDKQTIPENTTIIPDGKHYSARGNEHVDSVEFRGCKLTKVPQGLTRIFPNLKVLQIWKSGLKTVTKTDLAEYKNLERIYIKYNKIKYLPGDLFDGFKNLEAFEFSLNKLELIESNILDGLDTIKHVDFRWNPNYTKCYSQFSDWNPNATLEEVKDDLMVKFCKEFPKTTKDLFKIKEENKVLKDKNDELNAEVKNLKDEVDDVNAENRKFKSFLTDETFKDFQIQIGDHKFAVHKFLIAARSPTLAEILKNNPGLENLKLVDIPVGIFEVILKYFYTDELPGVDGMNVLHLFAAAKKLKIEELMKYAADKLIKMINKNNAIDILIISKNYEYDELRMKAFDEIKKNYPKVEFKDEWIADTDKLIKIIEIIKQKEEADRKMEEEIKKLAM